MMQPRSILVVSPDVTSLQGLTRALLRSGLPAAPALGWAEAESRLRRIPLSVVVTDVDEFGPDELITVRRLRAEFPNVAVIALVSLSTPEVVAAKTDGLILAILEKPITLGQLEEAVNLALSRGAVP